MKCTDRALMGGVDLPAAEMKKVITLGLEMAQIKDIDLLLERILTEARQLSHCDAGSIYIKEGDRLTFSYAQNQTMQRRLGEGKKLPYSTYTIPISSASIAGHVAEEGAALDIADVYALDQSSPYSFDRTYDQLTGYRTCSMLTLPLKSFRNDVIGVLQLINALDHSGNVVPFGGSNGALIDFFANSAANAIERAKMTRELILRMNRMAKMRDPHETTPHVNRVASYAVVLYEAWAVRKGIGQEEIDKNRDVLRMAAMLHDVGKVAIPDTILKKPGRLTPEEFEAMKMHTVFGANLFSDIYSSFDESAAIVALNHHERWDGNGYPGHIDPQSIDPVTGLNLEPARGKRGEEIPLFGRIVAIADVFDALSSRRCYKNAWEEGEVIETIRAEAGKQFDPELVELFLERIDSLRQIRKLYPDTHQ